MDHLPQNHRVYSLNKVDVKRYVVDPFNIPILGIGTPWESKDIIPCRSTKRGIHMEHPYGIEIIGETCYSVGHALNIDLINIKRDETHKFQSENVTIKSPRIKKFNSKIICRRLFVDGELTDTLDLSNVICDDVVFSGTIDISKIIGFPNTKSISLYLTASVDFSSVKPGIEKVCIWLDQKNSLSVKEFDISRVNGWHYLITNVDQTKIGSTHQLIDYKYAERNTFKIIDSSNQYHITRLNEILDIVNSSISQNRVDQIFEIMANYVDAYPDYEL